MGTTPNSIPEASISAPSVWLTILKNAWALFCTRWSIFLGGGIATVFLVMVGDVLLLFLPVSFSMLVVSALACAGLAPSVSRTGSRWWFWFDRLPSYWMTVFLLLAICAGTPLVISVAASSLVSHERYSGETVVIASLSIGALLDLYLLFRLWPLLVAAYLVGGRYVYSWPWHRSVLYFWEGPNWIGPGILRSFSWTSHPAVRRYFSLPASLAALVLLVTCLWAAILPAHGYLFLRVLVGLSVAVIGALTALVLVQCGWSAVMLSGDTPLVARPKGFELILPELSQSADEQERLRVFISRFPQNSGEYSTLLIPLLPEERIRTGLIEELRNLGCAQSSHDGCYIEMWSSNSEYRNGAYPAFVVDIQAAILGLLILRQDAEVVRRFRSLLIDWRRRLEIIGG